MKIKFTKDNILKSLSSVSNIVSEKHTIPVLANVLIEATENKTTLIATDLKISVEHGFIAEIVEEGSITVPAKRFISIIKELPDQIITMSVDKNNHVSILCGKSNFKIIGISKDEFPNIPNIIDEEVCLPQKVIKDLIKKTYYSMSNDSSNFVLNGLFFSIKGKDIIFVSTDRRRLAFAKKEMDAVQKIEKSIVIPAKMVNELQRILKDEGDVKIIFGEKEILFKIDDIKYISQLLDGQFPNYKQVIPDSEPICNIEINKEEFYGIVKRASVLTEKVVSKVRVDIKENKLYFSSKIPELGEFKEDIDVAYDEEEISIALNPQYILDALKNMEEETLNLKISKFLEKNVAIIAIADTFMCIVMPMELS